MAVISETLARLGDHPEIIRNVAFWRYCKLISACAFKRQTDIIERHHVIPQCVERGGITVELTPREHFIAHMLLVRFSSGNLRRKMWAAISMFATGCKNHNRKLSSRQYELARRAYSEARRGVAPSSKCRLAVSAAKRGVALSDEQRVKIGAALHVKHSFFLFDGNTYKSNDDFYSWCAENGAGRANLQSKMKKGIAVITAGKFRGFVFSFHDVGEQQMICERDKVVRQAKINRGRAVTTAWAIRKQQS